MNPYKLVVVDVDGTLFTSQQTITKKTMEAIQFIKDQGLAFAIASGRPIISVMNIIEENQLEALVDYIICSNGVETVNLRTNEIKKSHPLSKADVLEIGRIMAPYDVDYCCYVDDKLYTNKMNEITEAIIGRNILKPHVVAMEDLPFAETNKVLFTIFPKQYEALKDFQAKFKHPKYISFFTQPELFEFVDKRVSKAKGIEVIIDDLGITMDAVLAFGDAQNDLEMIEAVGLGVVMDNADAAIKAAGKAITKSNDADGIAHFIFNQLNWD